MIGTSTSSISQSRPWTTPERERKARRPEASESAFRKTLLDAFYRIAFRKTFDHRLDALQADLDEWIQDDNEDRTHQERWCFGKTPMQPFLDSLSLVCKQRPLSAMA